MNENQREVGLLLRAEPFERAEEISQRMVNVVRLKDGALLLKANHKWAEAICAVLKTRA